MGSEQFVLTEHPFDNRDPADEEHHHERQVGTGQARQIAEEHGDAARCRDLFPALRGDGEGETGPEAKACEDCCDLGDHGPRRRARPGYDRRSAMPPAVRGIGRVKGDCGHVTVTLRNRPSKMGPATGKDLTRRTGCTDERCEPGAPRGGAAATSRLPERDRLWKATRAVQVLVVEDDNAIGEPLATKLRREGFDVTLVQTAAAALSAPPADLVLLDLGLPDAHGFEVCRQLPRARQFRSSSSPPATTRRTGWSVSSSEPTTTS